MATKLPEVLFIGHPCTYLMHRMSWSFLLRNAGSQHRHTEKWKPRSSRRGGHVVEGGMRVDSLSVTPLLHQDHAQMTAVQIREERKAIVAWMLPLRMTTSNSLIEASQQALEVSISMREEYPLRQCWPSREGLESAGWLSRPGPLSYWS